MSPNESQPYQVIDGRVILYRGERFIGIQSYGRHAEADHVTREIARWLNVSGYVPHWHYEANGGLAEYHAERPGNAHTHGEEL